MNQSTKFTSRTAQTYETLREAIVQAKFLPGERLKIDVLCESIGASSGAVREALSRLTAEGLVVAEPQKGFEVAPISRKDLTELTEVRIAIETHCLKESIRHGGVEWETAVLSARHRLNALTPALRHPKSAKAEEWHRRHLEFHEALASGCPNECWLQLRYTLFMRSERYRRMSAPPVGERDRSIEAEHNEIADAALAHDSRKASLAMKNHLENTTDILLKSQLPFLENENSFVEEKTG